MGRLFVEYLESDGSGSKYVCSKCRIDVASDQALIWEGFMGANKPAFLFRSSINIEHCGPQREDVLSTGKYILRDVACRSCWTTLGWKYLNAEQPDQQYKRNCILLSQQSLTRVNRVTGTAIPGGSPSNGNSSQGTSVSSGSPPA